MPFQPTAILAVSRLVRWMRSLGRLRQISTGIHYIAFRGESAYRMRTDGHTTAAILMRLIRTETNEDYAAVRTVNERAFGRSAEADLVDALRRMADPFVSLVAVRKDEIVGHIFFSPVEIDPEPSSCTALGLAPMAVLPQYQKQGIGSQLVRRGLSTCKELGFSAVFVLGHSSYYPRFGFEPARQMGFQSEYDVPDEVFMALELQPHALERCGGTVKYHPEFGRME